MICFQHRNRIVPSVSYGSFLYNNIRCSVCHGGMVTKEPVESSPSAGYNVAINGDECTFTGMKIRKSPLSLQKDSGLISISSGVLRLHYVLDFGLIQIIVVPLELTPLGVRGTEVTLIWGIAQSHGSGHYCSLNVANTYRWCYICLFHFVYVFISC